MEEMIWHQHSVGAYDARLMDIRPDGWRFKTPWAERLYHVWWYMDNGHDTMFLAQHPEVIEAMQTIEENPLANGTDRQFCRDCLWDMDNPGLQGRLRRFPKLSLRQEVLQRDHCACRYCGAAVITGARLDHVIPYSLGGLTEKDNLATACHRCNAKKAGKTLEQAGMALLPIPE